MKTVFLQIFRLLKTIKFFLTAIQLKFKYKNFSENVINKNEQYELFITNNIGGGVSAFTNNYILEKKNIIILKNITYGKDFFYIVENILTNEKFILRFKDVSNLVNHKSITQIVVNSLVTNLHTFEFLRLLKESNKKIIVMVHDYYILCPNYTLFINHSHCNFQYCSTSKCKKKVNPFLIPNYSINEWREHWECFLQCINELRCFSNSSKEFVLQIYKTINPEKISVVPHSMNYCNFSHIKYKTNEIHVGIIGAITSEEKGALVVQNFLEYVNKNHIATTVIGPIRIKKRLHSKYINYYGPYLQKQLQDIITTENINVILFPSVCAETFSYLISELMIMNLPIVCFNYGAQAEKIKLYSKGVICQSIDPITIHQSLNKALKMESNND